jgi:hypothetical protein
VSYSGTPDSYLLGGFWPTWVLTMVASGSPFPVVHDAARRVDPIRPRQSPAPPGPARLLHRAAAATAFGVFSAVATAGVDGARSYVADLVAAAPGWYLPLLVVSAVTASVGQAGTNLYSRDRDLDAILLTRV